MGKVTLDKSLVEGTTSEIFLTFVEWMDHTYHTDEWSSRNVAVVSVLILGLIKMAMKTSYGICWYSLFHAAVTGYLTVICVWLNVYSAELLTGTMEPLRSMTCQGPLTSLHAIIPAISMGYGVFDILDSYGHTLDFLLHGIATFSIMAYFCEYGVPEIVTPMLLMEISSVHLNFLRAHFSELGTAVNMGFFVITFFITRLVICPYLMWGIIKTVWQVQSEEDEDNNGSACLPWHAKYVITLIGTFFNCLNLFWAYKIVRKVQRKLSGKEKVTQGNDMTNKEHRA